MDFETFAKSDYRAVKIKGVFRRTQEQEAFEVHAGRRLRKGPRDPSAGSMSIMSPEELVGKTAIAIVNLPPRKMMGIASEEC